jgi:hypothetical protein
MEPTCPPVAEVALRRGRKKRPAIRAAALVGRKYIRLLEAYLADLRQCYVHPNRVLHYDDVVVVYLLAFFNTAVRSLRCIEDASQLPGVGRHLSVEAVCKSTLSEANALFDPVHLEGLIARLRQDLPDLGRQHPDLQALLEQVQLVDGSFFRLAGDVAWAFQSCRVNGKPLGSVRLNCQWSLQTGVPSGISVSGDDGIGEGTAAMAFLEPDHIYIFDSGVVSFSYLQAILACPAHLVCVLHAHVNFDATASRPLSPQDQEAGVLSDTLGHLGGSNKYVPPGAVLREVKVQYIDRQGKLRTLRLLTDLLDLPAHLIAALYRYRWQIELFFRWLKVSANFRHLTSHSRNGVTLSFHIAVIACLLTALHTQQSLSTYSHMLLGFVAAGQADLEDILPILQRRERERQRDRARQAARRAAKKN